MSQLGRVEREQTACQVWPLKDLQGDISLNQHSVSVHERLKEQKKPALVLFIQFHAHFNGLIPIRA